MNDMQEALRDALAAVADVDPRELDEADRALWHLCDRRCAEIIERLVVEHDECGPTARAILQRFRLPG